MRDFTDPDARSADDVYNPSAAIVEAIKTAYGFIEFDLDGTIRRANDNFLNAVGYRNEEISGRHHRIFMPPGRPTRRNTGSSGRGSDAASSFGAASGGSGRTDSRSGFRPPTVRSATARANCAARSRSWSTCPRTSAFTRR